MSDHLFCRRLRCGGEEKNTLLNERGISQRSILRLGVLLLLFDVYLTWSRIEKSSTLPSTPLAKAPIIVQYLFFLTLNTFATLAHHMVVRLGAAAVVRRQQRSSASTDPLSSMLSDRANEFASTPTAAKTSLPPSTGVSRYSSSQDILQGLRSSSTSTSTSVSASASVSSHSHSHSHWAADATSSLSSPPHQSHLRRASTSPAQFQSVPPPQPPPPPSGNAVSTALFVGSCPKLFPILMVIWGSKEAAVPDAGSSTADSPAVALLHKTLTTAASMSLSTPGASTLVSGVISAGDAAISDSPSSSGLFNLASFTSAFGMPSSITSFLSLGTASTHLVLLNNIEALYILLNCGYLWAASLAVSGHISRWLVEKIVLSLFGIY